jgi:predicted membrane channel-forming protein YqfA (hemolysin III family)
VLFRVYWTDAPRWLYTPIYIAIGWSALFFIPGFIDGATSRLGTGMAIGVLVLIAAGGVLYTLGGAVYGFKFGPTPARGGSASTRSSTPSRSSPSSPTTSASRWRRTRCAERTAAVSLLTSRNQRVVRLVVQGKPCPPPRSCDV